MRLLLTAVLAAAGAALPAAASAAGPGAYRAIELAVDGAAVDINDRRQLLGYFVEQPNHPRPFVWQDGRFTDLGVLKPGPFEFAEPRDINNRGQVVGTSAVEDRPGWPVTHAFLWQNGVMTDLGTLGGPDSVAWAVNDRGQVFGSSYTATGEWHEFRWERGRMTDLGPNHNITDVNNRGQIVGQGPVDGQYQACRWYRDRVLALGFGVDSYAIAVNEAGWIVGSGSEAPGTPRRSYLWRAGVVTDLGALGEDAWAEDVNDRGEIIGNSGVGGVNHPFLWRGGRMTDLTLHGLPAGERIGALNNRGDIVRTGEPPVVYMRDPERG